MVVQRDPLAEPAPSDAGARPAIHVTDLAKRYGDTDAVRGVSFAVPPGEVFAFLGPNGAGKSTTINMLCTLARPTGGTATVAGCDIARQPRRVRQHIGLVFQDQTLDPQLTAEENLRLHAVLYRMPRNEIADRIDQVLRLVDLADRKRSRVATFSGGMSRRLEIARALVHTPEVLFLDEPTVGLDPQTRSRIWADVLRLRERDVTIFFTTHYMDEAENADRIAIIDQGEIIACDTPAALKAVVGADAITLVTADDAVAEDALVRTGYEARSTPDGLRVFVSDCERAVSDIVTSVGVQIHQLSMHRPTLDDVFLHFTGRAIRAEEPGATELERAVRHVIARRR